MKRALVIIDQDPVLAKLVNEIHDIKDKHMARIKELQDQADRLGAGVKADVRARVQRIETYLKTKGMLNDFNPETEHVCMRHGVLFIHDDSDDADPLSSMFDAIRRHNEQQGGDEQSPEEMN